MNEPELNSADEQLRDRSRREALRREIRREQESRESVLYSPDDVDELRRELRDATFATIRQWCRGQRELRRIPSSMESIEIELLAAVSKVFVEEKP